MLPFKGVLIRRKKCGFRGHRMKKKKEKNKIVCVSAPMVKKQTNKKTEEEPNDGTGQAKVL